MIIETLLVISPILNDISDNSLEFRSMRYIGAAANINITAFSLIYKVPVLFYFLENSKKRLNKLLISSLLFLVIFIVSILGTRGAYIGVGICVLVFVFYVIVSNANFIKKIKKTAWIFLPLILAVLMNIQLSSESDNNVISRASTINISTNDGSVNQRLRYYNDAFNQFIKKPIFGVGIGNWKLESIDYDKNNINGFIVPYHAHNDFLQILAESGILGLTSYLLFLFYSTKVLFKKSVFDNHLNIFLLGSFAIFILDSLLNFPIARPISQLFLIALFTLISSYDRKSTE
ncbi:MAG: O-antigen ligase family protein [Flavobacteriaceae bacterium]